MHVPARGFRDYASASRPAVREFYRLNHRHQTLEFVRAKKREYLPPRRRTMTVWEALSLLDAMNDRDRRMFDWVRAFNP